MKTAKFKTMGNDPHRRSSALIGGSNSSSNWPLARFPVQSRAAQRMFRHGPNLLTGLRLVLAIVFFGMISWYQHEGRGDPWFLIYASLIYVIALMTDFLDGYLARKYNLE